jgi:hypothetical protein
MRRLPVPYPVFLGAAWALLFFEMTTAPLAALWRPLVIIIVGSTMVWALALLVLRDRNVSAFVAALIVCLALGFWVFAGPLLVIATAWPVLRLRRRLARHRSLPPLQFERVSSAIQVVSTVLLVLAIGNGVVGGAFASSAPPAEDPVLATSGGSTPNIYMILLDGYPNLATAATAFGIDNEPFARSLEELGFDVYRDSRSNYMQTWTTLASMFWMRYVSEIPGLDHPPSGDAAQTRAVNRAINDGPALAMLRARGYRIITSPSSLASTRLYLADQVLDDGYLTDLEGNLLRFSAVRIVADGFLRRIAGDQARGSIEQAFTHISRVLDERDERPIFFFDHVLSPHPPFVHHADGTPQDIPACYPKVCGLGSPLALENASSWAEFAGRLREQLTFLNARTLVGVRAIIARDPDAVIIVFSDHGTRSDLANRPEWFSSLLAARTPQHPNLFSGDAPSPVNYLAELFNAYFRTNLPVWDYHAYWATRLVLDLEEFRLPASSR